MKTIFNHDLITKLIENKALVVPGLKKIKVNFYDKFDQNKIFIDVWFKKQIINLKSIIYDLQKTIFFNLSNQLDTTDIKINIIVHS